MIQKFNWRYALIIPGICLGMLMGCKSDTPTSDMFKSTSTSPVEDLNSGIASSPDDPSLYFKRSKFYYDAKNYSNAIADLKKCIGLDVKNPLYYQALADVYMDSYQSRKAIDILLAGTKASPEDMVTRLKYINFLLIYKQYKQALGATGDVLKRDPQNAEVFFLRGMIFKETENDSLAIVNFQRAVDINPDMVDAYMSLGDLYEQKGDGLALMYYENAIKVDPKAPLPLHAKAYYLQNSGKINEAIDIYKEIISAEPNYIAAYLNLGVLFYELDSLQSAYNQFNILISIDNSIPEGYYYRGLISSKIGLKNKAIDDLQQALNLDPNLEEAKIGLKKLLKQ